MHGPLHPYLVKTIVKSISVIVYTHAFTSLKLLVRTLENWVVITLEWPYLYPWDKAYRQFPVASCVLFTLAM